MQGVGEIQRKKEKHGFSLARLYKKKKTRIDQIAAVI